MMIRLGVFVFLIGVSAVSSIQTYYMDLHCGQSLDFSIAGLYQIRLKFTSRSTYRSNTNCVFYLKTETSERFMLFFKSVKTASCSHAYLNVYDGNNTITPVSGLGKKCGYQDYTSSVYTTRGNGLTLQFLSDSYMLVDKGFDMVITSYHTGSCYGYEYECDNGRCIYDALECNGYNPCGDSSDCDLSGGAIAGIVIGCFVFVVIITTVLIMARRRRRGHRTTLVSETTAFGSAGYNGYNKPPPAYPTGQQYPPPGQPQPPAMQYPQN